MLLSAPNGARSSHETVKIYRRTDHLCAEIGREWHAGARRLSAGWRVGGDLLHVYADFGVSELRKLKQLEDENARLRRIVADLILDKQILQEVVRKNL